MNNKYGMFPYYYGTLIYSYNINDYIIKFWDESQNQQWKIWYTCFFETLQLASGKVNSAEFQWIRKLPLKGQTRLSSWVQIFTVMTGDPGENNERSICAS